MHALTAGAGRRALILALCAGVAACGGGGRSSPSEPAAADQRVLRVPQSYKSIQAAVDASRPGDLVLLAPGRYREAVEVDEQHPRIVIRGVDRNRVVLDGEDRLESGISVRADGVAVENLTVRRYAVNGVVFAPDPDYRGPGRQLQGWRGSYITAYDNGLYGVYAFGAQHGRFDHVYASGHPDSGIYLGRCKPCDALVRDSVAEANHVGYEATNASGGVVVMRNRLVRNRVGAQINSLTKEATAPQEGSTLVANLVADNQNAKAPRGSQGFGAGIVVNGGRRNEVLRNRIQGHRGVGILVLDSPDYVARSNRIADNRLASNRVDVALESREASSNGTCFTGNRPRRSVPEQIERRTRCDGSVPLRGDTVRLPKAPPQVDYRGVAAPPAQPSMPGANGARVRPAVGLPERVDVGDAAVPR